MIKKEDIIEDNKAMIKKERPRQNISMPEKKPNVSFSENRMDVEKVLVENFVSLQKVMTNLAVKFDNLSDQISKLLELFEISAKTLAEKGAMGDDKKILEKIDSLLDQNKVIAKGIALLHERSIMPEEQEVIIPQQPIMQQRPMQRMQPSNQPMQRPAPAEFPRPALRRTEE
jgi:hypothetical protein